MGRKRKGGVESEARPGELRVIAGGDEREEIVITEELADVADKAAAALAHDGAIYQRGGALVHVVTPTAAPGTTPAPAIRELPISILHVRLAQVVRWLKLNARGDYKRAPVPAAIVSAVHARGQWDAVRPLVGVLTAPTIRPDGSVLQAPGYDEATALLFWPERTFVEVPESPTRDDAIGAASALLELVEEFPFATQADRSAWLAGVLTLVGRPAVQGPCPLFAVDANTRGSGKSKLVDVASSLAFGRKADRSSLAGNDEEMRKQITSLLRDGAPAVLIDNLRPGQRVGGAAFDALLTSDTWKDRELGKTAMLTLPARAVWFATGNNLQFAGDMTRRALKMRLDSPLENPEAREGFRYGDVVGEAMRRRHFAVSQALIILRAHAVAGRPLCGPVWGSFESWTRVIAAAVRWLGLPDPLEVRATSDEAADEERLHAAAVMAGLEAMASPKTAREIVVELYPNDYHDGAPDLFSAYAPMRDALEAATASKGTPSSLNVGRFLKRVLGRVIDGKAIACELDRHTKVQRWTVRKVAASEGTV